MIVDQRAAGFKLSAEARSVSDVLALATLYGTGRQVELTAADPGLDVLINADILGCIAPFADGEMRRLAPLLFDAREELAAQLHDVHLLRAGMTSGMTSHVLPGR